MKKFILVVAMVVLGLPALAKADLITTLYNTGVDNNGVGLSTGQTDSHYTVSYNSTYNNSAFSGTGLGSPTALTSNSGYPFPYWTPSLNTQGASNWIQPAAGSIQGNNQGNAPIGYYDYQTTFTANAGAVIGITGGLISDNTTVGIFLNGKSITTWAPQSDPNGGFSSPSFFQIAGIAIPGGTQTLDFVVNNYDAGVNNGLNATGLDVSMSGTVSSMPEPSAFGLGVTGLACGLAVYTAIRHFRLVPSMS